MGHLTPKGAEPMYHWMDGWMDEWMEGWIPKTGHAYLPTCLMYCTGCPSSSGSCSVLMPWSGGVSWVLLRPTSEIFAVPPRASEVAVHSAHRNRGYSLFLLLVHVPPQPRPAHSRWLAPLCGIGFICRRDFSPGFFVTHFTLASKLFSLAMQGSGALLSSSLERALYKSP